MFDLQTDKLVLDGLGINADQPKWAIINDDDR